MGGAPIERGRNGWGDEQREICLGVAPTNSIGDLKGRSALAPSRLTSEPYDEAA